MRAYDEFRVVVTPVAAPGPPQWTVRIEECGLPALIGTSANVQPVMTRAQLADLRRGNMWTNLQKLKQIGSSVWLSTLGPLAPSLKASLAVAQHAGRGMRVVVVRQGEEPVGPPNDHVAVAELPIEVACDPAGEFLALDELTPVSRGLQVRPDISSKLILPPLRVLLVVARPGDKPGANEQQEAAEIRNALSGLGQDVRLIECAQGTYDEFGAMVDQHDPHVIHFCGHGGYAVVGDDPTPRPHLCFVRSDNGDTREVDADTLAVKLRNRSVRLVVLTACASAATGPANGPYWPGALEGIAQRLVLGTSGVTAAVAMQFDLEADAAVAFSRAFYQKLLEEGCSLDTAVTCARLAITQAKDVGHRAWVNPAVFWRCKDGHVFDVASVIDPALVSELGKCQTHLDANFNFLSAPNLTAGQAQFVLAQIAEIEDRRSQLYRQCLRLSPETAPPGGPARFRILLRTSAAGSVDQVRFAVAWPADLGPVAAESTPGGPKPALAQENLTHRIIVDQASGGAVWPAGEREIGVLTLTIPAGQAAGLVRPELADAAVVMAGAAAPLRALEPILFVHQP
jgi:hypothetical protein